MALETGDVVYISGPMTGFGCYNLRAFHAAAHALESAGYRVLNPANGPPGLSWTEYMRIDLDLLRLATAVLLLHGYERSRGARIELEVAEMCGLKIIRPC